jgi:hypothetical protein
MDSLGGNVMLEEDTGGEFGRATDPIQSMEILDNWKSLNMVAVMYMMFILWLSICR